MNTSHLEPPEIFGEVDLALGRAVSLVRALPAATPKNAGDERRRLVDAFRRGDPQAPRWTYDARPPEGELSSLLTRALASLEHDGSPLALAYRARIEELLRDAALEASVGTRDFARAAEARYGSLGGDVAREADALADAWMREPKTALDHEPLCASDADVPESLTMRLREEVARARLPFRVVRHERLASLAATGSDAIFVGVGRMLTREATERTVLHEVRGHVMPRARAREQSLGLFSLGTARGTDEQEGYALLLEERAGFLRGERRRELAARHTATRAMRTGATFVDVVSLTMERGLELEAALRIAERAFRGSDGASPGLGREGVYLETFVHVRAWLAEKPDDEAVLASGQVATGAIDVVRPYWRPWSVTEP